MIFPSIVEKPTNQYYIFKTIERKNSSQNIIHFKPNIYLEFLDKKIEITYNLFI